MLLKELLSENREPKLFDLIDNNEFHRAIPKAVIDAEKLGSYKALIKLGLKREDDPRGNAPGIITFYVPGTSGYEFRVDAFGDSDIKTTRGRNFVPLRGKPSIKLQMQVLDKDGSNVDELLSFNYDYAFKAIFSKAELEVKIESDFRKNREDENAMFVKLHQQMMKNIKN